MNDSICSVPTCDRPSRLTGLCGAHHQRKLRHGDVREHIPLRGTDSDPTAFWCSKCHTHQPKNNFYAEPRARRGISGVCKQCCKASNEARADTIKANRRAWVAANPERERANKRRAYLREDPAKRNARNNAWRHSDRARLQRQIRAQNSARYARLKNAPGKATHVQIAARWDYYGGKCWMCGKPATDTDHVKPLAKGGSNWPANMRPACRTCNRAKSAHWPYDPRGGAWQQSTRSPGSRSWQSPTRRRSSTSTRAQSDRVKPSPP